MSHAIRYEILEGLPTSGPMYIPVSRNGIPFYSEGFVVRFFTADGNEWVGNFETGWTQLNSVIELSECSYLFVFAGGTCYVMNPDNQTPIEVFGVGFQNILNADQGRVVLPEQCDLTILEPNGTHWETKRISLDGLRNVVVGENIVTGLGYEIDGSGDGWYPFEYDLNSKTLESSYPQKKSWWKFW